MWLSATEYGCTSAQRYDAHRVARTFRTLFSLTRPWILGSYDTASNKSKNRFIGGSLNTKCCVTPLLFYLPLLKNKQFLTGDFGRTFVILKLWVTALKIHEMQVRHVNFNLEMRFRS